MSEEAQGGESNGVAGDGGAVPVDGHGGGGSVAGEGGEVQEAQEAQEVDFDALLDAALSGEEFQEGVNHKGVDYNSTMEALTPDARKLIHNLRESYRQKTTSLADQRRSLQQERDRMSEREHALTRIDVAPAEMDKTTLPENFDLWNPDHLKLFIEQKAEERANAILEAKIKPAQDQIRQDQRKAEVRRYMGEHSEFSDEGVKHQIALILAENPNMKVEQAHREWIAKTAPTRIQQLEAELAEARAERRKMGEGVASGSGGGASNGAGKPRTAWEAYQLRKQAGTLPGRS